MLSRGCDPENDSIIVEIQYRMEITGKERLVTYSVEIGEVGGQPVVLREVLRYKRGRHNKPFHFLDFTQGDGYAIVNEEDFTKSEEELERETQKWPRCTGDQRTGAVQAVQGCQCLRQLIEHWHVSDFHISAARGRRMRLAIRSI